MKLEIGHYYKAYAEYELSGIYEEYFCVHDFDSEEYFTSSISGMPMIIPLNSIASDLIITEISEEEFKNLVFDAWLKEKAASAKHEKKEKEIRLIRYEYDHEEIDPEFDIFSRKEKK